ncbi:protease modulator HflC [Amphritea sp. 2_MG-2023]|jgi:membrane protease subunit HflC|uniref:protease modulator HflC n=1 Tax=Amphritea TaxID=515417 RepID=UPI001C076104|nr:MULTISPECIES: protease modulator HflC [Amphritea]MBU2967250.1 protease modulator HflC [Amphritea atlantica]MDO6419252.1 protease modulator HflC [Amphritea sp. 2_MG-2023]MDX2421626.1 protease modulator HflC [Amphritea sp.]
MSGKSMTGLVIALLLVVVGFNTLYIIKETDRAVLLKFGEIVNPDIKPGLHIMIPVINKIRKFDGRVQTLDAQAQSYLTVEKKRLIVDSFIKWRIVDPQKYYTATSGDEYKAAELLFPNVDAGLRNQFGERTLTEVVSGERDELMVELVNSLSVQTKDELGIEMIDIRVKKIDLPQEVSASVYERMRTEREREARELRSRGKELAEGIQADADRQKAVIEANAYRDAQQVRGEGDALAAKVYADAYNKDAEFYSFYRSLNAYKAAFNQQGDIMVLKPDSEFFRYLGNPSGKPAK